MDYRFLEAAKAGDLDTVQVSFPTQEWDRKRYFLFSVWSTSCVLCLLSFSTGLCLRQQLCSPQNVNCRDLEGRHSTPLHFAAGYNRVAVVEFLLHHGADVHAKDKGSVLRYCHHFSCNHCHHHLTWLPVGLLQWPGSAT